MNIPIWTKSSVKALLVILLPVAVACQNISAKYGIGTSQYLVGSYAKAGEPGIYRIELNNDTGAITNISVLARSANPSYLTRFISTGTLFAVNETAKGGVSRFDWNNNASQFELTTSVSGLSDSPCYLSISPDGSMLAIANYVSSDLHLMKIDGQSLVQIGHTKLEGKGPHKRQKVPHLHWADWSPEGNFLYAVDLGSDRIMAYQTAQGGLSNGVVAAHLTAGDGPRHMAFHPSLKLAYVINELSNTVVVFARNINTGIFTEVQRIASQGVFEHGVSRGAAIKLSPDQRFLYVSNRGPNTISVFKLDGLGKLTFLQEQATGGDWPRDFTFTSDGRFIIVANTRSNSINVLPRDTATGLLGASRHHIKVSKPTFLTPN